MDDSVSDNEWLITCERFVAFIDIMGFKDMLLRDGHDAVFSMLQKIQKDANRIVSKPLYSESGERTTKFSLYSDSIMIYSTDNSKAAQVNFMLTVARFSSSLLQNFIPFKGAIAFGKMTVDFNASIFMGQPLIDAYLLQDELQLYGIVTHGTYDKFIDYNNYQQALTLNYNCPFKSYKSSHYLVVPFLMFAKTIKEVEVVAKEILHSPAEYAYSVSGGLRHYVDNTRAFLEHCNDLIEQVLPEQPLK